MLYEVILSYDFDQLLKSIGLRCLSRMDCPTIPEVTIDFLATLEFRYENPSTPVPSQGRLSFKVGRQAFSLSIPELCQAYGLNASATKVEFRAEDNFV